MSAPGRVYVCERRGDMQCHTDGCHCTERFAIAILVSIGKRATWDPLAHDHDVLGGCDNVKDADKCSSLEAGRITRSGSDSFGARVICGNDGDRNRACKRGVFSTPQGHSLRPRH
jgi:hypothetical protein